MRVAVQPRRGTVSSPSGVSDTGMGIKDLGVIGLRFSDERLELGDLANFLEGKDFVLLITINR